MKTVQTGRASPATAVSVIYSFLIDHAGKSNDIQPVDPESPPVAPALSKLTGGSAGSMVRHNVNEFPAASVVAHGRALPGVKGYIFVLLAILPGKGKKKAVWDGFG